MLHQQLIILRSLGHSLPWRPCLDPMILRRAPLVWNVGVEPLGAHITARISGGVLLIHEVRLARMIAAMINFCPKELLVARRAFEFLEASEHLPENVLPRNLLLPQEHHKFVNVPVLVTLVLCNCVSVVVYKQIGLRTLDPLPLIASVQ